MRAGEFTIRYQVIQRDDGSPHRIVFRDVPRDLFELLPLKERTHYSEPGSGPTFYIKEMRKLNADWWFITYEDSAGNIEGVLPPEEESSAIVLVEPEGSR